MTLTKWPKEGEQIYMILNGEVHRCLYKERNVNQQCLVVELLSNKEIVDCSSSNLYSSLQEAEEAFWGYNSPKKETYWDAYEREYHKNSRSNNITAASYGGCEQCRRVLRNGEKCDCQIGIRA